MLGSTSVADAVNGLGGGNGMDGCGVGNSYVVR